MQISDSLSDVRLVSLDRRFAWRSSVFSKKLRTVRALPKLRSLEATKRSKYFMSASSTSFNNAYSNPGKCSVPKKQDYTAN